MAGVEGALTTLVLLVCSAANSAQYIPHGENPGHSFLPDRYVTVVFPEAIVHDRIRAAALKMHPSPGFTCTSLMGPTCLYAEKQQGNRASSDNLTRSIHIATDLLFPDPSHTTAYANAALPDYSREVTMPVQHKAGQHQLETIDSHSKSADGCEQLIDAAGQTVSPSQPRIAAAEEPAAASECAAAVPQGGNGIMAQYLAASQDQLGAVHGHSDPIGKHWQRIGASSEGKLDDVVYVRVGKRGGVQSVYDGAFDGSMNPRGEGETQGVCQSNENTQE